MPRSSCDLSITWCLGLITSGLEVIFPDTLLMFGLLLGINYRGMIVLVGGVLIFLVFVFFILVELNIKPLHSLITFLVMLFGGYALVGRVFHRISHWDT